MSTDREIWLMGRSTPARLAIATQLRAENRRVVETDPFAADILTWASAGWPLLVVVVTPRGIPALVERLRACHEVGVPTPVLAILIGGGGGGDLAALVAGGVADVMCWPADSPSLGLRIDLLAARSGGETLVRDRLFRRDEGALFVYDVPARRVRWIDASVERSLGIEASRVLDVPDRELASYLHPEDLPRFLDRMAEIGRATERILGVAEYRIRLGGGWRWIRIQGVVVTRLPDGAPGQVLAVASDVTAWRAPEDALRTVLEGTAAVGDGFFRSLTREVARFLGVRYVLVGEIALAEGETFRSAAFWGDGAYQPRVEFSIPGSAAEEVGFGRAVYHATRVRELFPADVTLERYGVDGVLGLPILDEAGRAIGMLLAWHDGPLEVEPAGRTLVSALALRAGAELERARGDAALRTEEERLRVATAAGGVGVWDWNIITDELVWKGQADAIFGDPGVAASRSTGAFWDRVHPDDFRRGRAAFQRALDGDERVATELRYLRTDGALRWIAVRGEMFRDGESRPVRMTGTIVDITISRAAEDRVRESEERLKLALGGARAGLWDWDFVRGSIYYSPEWEAMLGYAPGTLAQEISAWQEVVHPDDRALVGRELVRHLKGQTEIYETEHRLRHLDGSWVWVLDRGKVVERSANGRAVRMTGIQTDISARKQLEMQLLLADRMSTVGTLASGIAHEVNNPLAYVIGNLEYLLNLADTASTPANNRTRRALTDAIDGAERVRAIVADLKTFSTPDTDSGRPVDPHQVIDAALRVAHNELRHQSRLEKVFTARNLVVGSESKLGQVLVNLITNALQALPPERSSDQNLIRITTTDEGDDVVIDVEDNGIGMTADVMRRVFDPFFTTHPVGSATGLGLTAAHNVVKGMGGRLTVESELGRGSHFRVVLPVATVVDAPAQADSWSPERSIPPGGLVLVVDDEPMIAGVIEAMLVNTYAVVKVDGAAAALARLRAGETYDAILCDLMMPSMTGMAFFDEVQRLWPSQAERTGFVTGGAFTRAASDFVAQMHSRCIDKPFDGMTLRRFVKWLAARESSPAA